MHIELSIRDGISAQRYVLSLSYVPLVDKAKPLGNDTKPGRNGDNTTLLSGMIALRSRR